MQSQGLLLATRQVLEPREMLPPHVAIADDIGDFGKKLGLDLWVRGDFEEEGRHG